MIRPRSPAAAKSACRRRRRAVGRWRVRHPEVSVEAAESAACARRRRCGRRCGRATVGPSGCRDGGCCPARGALTETLRSSRADGRRRVATWTRCTGRVQPSSELCRVRPWRPAAALGVGGPAHGRRRRRLPGSRRSGRGPTATRTTARAEPNPFAPGHAVGTIAGAASASRTVATGVPAARGRQPGECRRPDGNRPANARPRPPRVRIRTSHVAPERTGRRPPCPPSAPTRRRQHRARARTEQHPLRPRERAHLAASRAALRAMREDAEALDIRDVTANWVNAAVLQRQIDDRIKALADLSHTPLFFGRLDYLHAPGADQAEGARGRAVLHRAPPRARRRRRPDGHRLARARLPAVLPGLQEGPAGRRAAPPLRLHRRRADRVRGRAPHRPGGGRADQQAAPGGDRAARASARCATSSRRSSPSRTRSSAPGSAARSASRAAPAPGRPPSACTVSPTCCTRTASGWPAPAPSSSARTGSFLHYIEQVLPALGELEVKQATVDDLVGARRGARHGRRRRRARSRATPGWRRCCGGRSART